MCPQFTLRYISDYLKWTFNNRGSLLCR